MKINLYAPCDGIIHPIEDLNDGVFSQKALGDGFFIEPITNTICSPLESATVSLIFETQHAFYIENKKTRLLIHIGIDTVALNGDGFKTAVTLNQKIKKNDILTSIDFELLEKRNLNKAIIVAIDSEKGESILHLKISKNQIKQGQLIGYLEVKKSPIKTEKSNLWKDISEDILKNVGGNNNFNSYYNCMTRLRIKINDKQLVDEDTLKNLAKVKGINWSGNELQIIIGGDAYKVKDEFDFILKSKNIKTEKKGAWRTITQFISNVMIPALPVLMATGIIAGIQALFAQFGWVQVPSAELPETQLNLFSMLLFIGSKVGLEMIGIVFCYNTVKYLGGDPIMGIFLGIALTTRHFLGSGFGEGALNWQHDGKGYYLFQLFGNKIYIKGYESSIIPLITGGIFLFYVDKFVKKWMPGAVDIVFRPAIVFMTAFVATLFIIGPITGIIEQLLGQSVIAIGDLPIGLGVAIFCGFWQILVLTGVHIAVANAVKFPIMANQGSSMLAAGFGIAILAQFGACIGVFLRTRDQKLKQAAVGAMPSIIFGISEPTIFGVNLPKIRPFVCGSIAAFFGGMLSGILKLDADVIGGGGFLQIMWFTDSILEMILYLMVLLITITIACLLTLTFFSERKTELKQVKTLNWSIKKYLVINNRVSKKEYNLLLNDKEKNIIVDLNNNKKEYYKYEKLKLEEIKLKQKLENSAAGKINNKNFENKINDIKVNLKEQEIVINDFNKKMIKVIDNYLTEISYVSKNNELLILRNDYLNSLNSLFNIYNNREKMESHLEVTNLNFKNKLLYVFRK
ncbi:glucose PTS transporter subunit IIA [Spiroplasma cantharicola]|uniref:PTS system, N-acetylmuramic acid-specific EIIBC component n=1 Tax=Spiroplasma cantharicola TaxID=362837 RepID=A0A0M4KEE5_9MOLU|nr:glucose PTS transporter subunit IIA [Spiroplasma cantharicola]ALD66345.1 PTS system, N-acetylmuramic acid-specific EIIBC component [Spiroplasma cantharicola]